MSEKDKMKFSLKSLLGAVLRGDRTTREEEAYGVPVKKEELQNLNTSDRLKLEKAAIEGGADESTFFESDVQTGGGFGVVCDLYTCLESLSTAMSFCDMGEAFKTLPSENIVLLEIRLEDCFNS